MISEVRLYSDAMNIQNTSAVVRKKPALKHLSPLADSLVRYRPEYFIAYVRITMFDYGAVEIQDNYEFLIGHVTSV